MPTGTLGRLARECRNCIEGCQTAGNPHFKEIHTDLRLIHTRDINEATRSLDQPMLKLLRTQNLGKLWRMRSKTWEMVIIGSKFDILQFSM